MHSAFSPPPLRHVLSEAHCRPSKRIDWMKGDARQKREEEHVTRCEQSLIIGECRCILLHPFNSLLKAIRLMKERRSDAFGFSSHPSYSLSRINIKESVKAVITSSTMWKGTLGQTCLWNSGSTSDLDPTSPSSSGQVVISTC